MLFFRNHIIFDIFVLDIIMITEDKTLLFCCVVADVILIVSILLFCKIIFRFKEYKNGYSGVKIFLSGGIVVLLSVWLNLSDDVITDTIIYILAVFLLLCSMFNEKVIVLFVTTLWVIVIIGMLDTMSVVLIEISEKALGNINLGLTRLLRALILFLFVIIVGKLYNKKYNVGIKTIGVGSLIAFTMLTIIDTFIVMVIAFITTIEERLTEQMIYYVAFILVILGLFLQLGAVILILLQRNIYKESQQLTQRYLEEQKNHYEYLEKRETETKKFRHDLRSHMEMLSVLAKERRYDEFDKYVEEINLNIDRFGNNVTVQNGIVDAIINKYYSEAVANEVNMEVKGRFPSDCKIDAYHLCTIFSNILSNALEATVEASKKWISVECRYTDDNILVVVKNTFDNKDTARNGKARTHKQDTNNHGFGLENVKDSIRKYNGLYVIDTNEDIYTITISFNYIRQE